MSVRAMAWVWDQELPPNLKIVLLAIADHADDSGGEAFPSQQTLARKTGYTDRQVKRIIDQLVGIGALHVGRATLPGRRGDRQPNIYRIRMNTPVAVSRSDLPKMAVDRDMRAEVIEAFAGTCYWCGGVGTNLKDPSGVAWEIDRLVSGREGGSYERANVVLSCRACNRSRGVTMSSRDGGTPMSHRERDGGTSEPQRGDILSTNGGTPMSYEPSSEPSIEPPNLFPDAPRQVEPAGAAALTAREITAHWVDTYRAVHAETPVGQSVKRVAQAAKQLLDEGRAPDVILSAAADAATGGHANLAASVTYLLARNKTHGRITEPRGFSGIRDFLEGA